MEHTSLRSLQRLCFLKGISLLAVVSLSQLSGRSSNIKTSQIAFAIKLKIKKNPTIAAVIGVPLFSQSLQTESSSLKNAGAFLQSLMRKL